MLISGVSNGTMPISASATIQESHLFRNLATHRDYLQVRDYPATIKVGGFYDSEPLRQFESHRITRTWMVYGLAEQRLYTAEPGTKRGLTGLLGFAYATPWLHVQPDVQGVIRPNGTRLVSDALVLAIQVGIDL
jgi:hypothetical protein